MWVSEITEDNLSDEVIGRLLFEGINDDGEKADCIIVLGSIKATQYRVPKESIIVESNSQNTIENLLYAMVELQRIM